MQREVSQSTLRRLPTYLTYLKGLPPDAPANISSAAIAAAIGAGEIQVRKDLASVSDSGRPKTGYPVAELIADLTEFLGYNDVSDAIVVGCGKLGEALLGYGGFQEYGLNLVAGFDTDPARIHEQADKPVLPLEKLAGLCEQRGIRVAILTVPASYAQAACDRLVAAGIRAILNFAPAHLDVPHGVLVKNENLAVSLAQLSNDLVQQPGENS